MATQEVVQTDEEDAFAAAILSGVREEDGIMKAMVARRYGSPERLHFEEIARPELTDDRVIIEVHAASVNPADIHTLRGSIAVRPANGLRKPKNPVPGIDVAGVVTEVGKHVSLLDPGDGVYGGSGGSFAPFARARERFLAPMPRGVTFEQAAAIPVAGITALQGLRDKGQLKPGQTVLINGAAGGVGTFAVQIAKALGAEVTAVCSTRNADLVRSLGADHVVDYTREDFARGAKKYDLVLDLVGNRSLSDLRRALKSSGTLVLSGEAHDRGHGARGLLKPLRLMAKAMILRRFVNQQLTTFLAKINTQDLLTLNGLIESGKLTPIIDRTYPRSEAPAAMRYLQAGHARGKVVITV